MPRKYGKSLATIISAFFIAVLLAGGYARASQVDDLRSRIEQRNQEIKALEEEIAQYKSKIDTTENQAKTLKNQISTINATVSKLNADIKYTQSKIGKAELEIQRLLLEIADKEEKINSNRGALAQAIRNVYETESQSLVEILLARDQLSDFFNELKYMEDLQNGVGDNLATLHQIKEDLQNTEVKQQNEKANLLDLKGELTDRKVIQKNAYNDKNALLKETKNKEAEYQKMLAAREKERIDILNEISAIENELRKLIDPSALPAARKGVLAWPVENPYITQGFGLTAFAQYNSDVYKGGGHNGIDLRAPVGTPIYAADEGIILRTGNSDLSCPGGSYGKWIVIEHPNNLATLYAHLSLIKISDGEHVSRGQLIAYGGNTGYTTGPHLHFTVYAAGKAGEIRFGPSSSGRCKLLPYGGYLNPLDYL